MAVGALVAFENLVVPVVLMNAHYGCDVWWDDLLDSYAQTQYAISIMIVSEAIARLSDQMVCPVRDKSMCDERRKSNQREHSANYIIKYLPSQW